jgi:tetratricopeptide (TPR) repeat protein
MMVDRLKKYGPWILTLIVALIVFRPWRNAEFLLWDDDSNVTANPFLQPASWSHLFEFWTRFYENLYVPITYSVWSAVAALTQTFYGPFWANDQFSWPFLVTNLAFHILNGYLVFRLLKNFTKVPEFALLGVALFLFHPAQVQSVATVSGLKELIWSAFALASLCALFELRMRRVLIFGALALLSKPTAAVLPLILSIAALTSETLKPQRKKLMVSLLPLWLAGFSLLILTKTKQGDQWMLEVLSWPNRFLILLDTFGFYLRTAIWPFNLCFDYSRTPGWVMSHSPTPEMFITLAVAIGALTLVFWRKQLRPQALLLATLFFASLAPLSGLIPFLQQNYSTVIDHYLYLSLTALGVLAVFALNRWPQKLVIGSFFIVLFSFAIYDTQLVNDLRTNESIFYAILKKNPDSFMSENNLGVFYAKIGKDEESLAHLRRSAELKPRNAPALINIGRLLYKMGRYDESIAQFEKIGPASNHLFDYHLGYGTVLGQVHQDAKALTALERAVEMRPDNDFAQASLGVVLCRLNRCDEALPHFLIAQRILPQNPQYQGYVEYARSQIKK